MQYKVTLTSGKVVVFRKLKIKDYHMAAEVAGKASNQTSVSLLLMDELIRNSLVAVNEKTLTAAERQDLDAHFEMDEYAEVKMFMQEVSGNATAPKIEVLA
jgi:hypothetical protein